MDSVIRVVSGIYTIFFIVPFACVTIIIMSVFEAFNNLTYYKFMQEAVNVDKSMDKYNHLWETFSPAFRILVTIIVLFLTPIIRIFPSIHNHIKNTIL